MPIYVMMMQMMYVRKLRQNNMFFLSKNLSHELLMATQTNQSATQSHFVSPNAWVRLGALLTWLLP